MDKEYKRIWEEYESIVQILADLTGKELETVKQEISEAVAQDATKDDLLDKILGL